MAHFTDTITLLVKFREIPFDPPAYHGYVIRGAQWRERIDQITDTMGIVSYEKRISITIPYKPELETVMSKIDVRRGTDLCLLGDFENMLPDEITPSILAKAPHGQGHEGGLIYAVIDNTNRDKLKHWRIYAK